MCNMELLLSLIICRDTKRFQCRQPEGDQAVITKQNKKKPLTTSTAMHVHIYNLKQSPPLFLFHKVVIYHSLVPITVFKVLFYSFLLYTISFSCRMYIGVQRRMSTCVTSSKSSSICSNKSPGLVCPLYSISPTITINLPLNFARSPS